MRHPRYVQAAHRRSVLEQLRRILRIDYLASGATPPKKELFCEDVVYADRVITQAAFHDVDQYLDLLMQREDGLLARFQFTERDPIELPKTITLEAASEAPKEEQPMPKKTKPKAVQAAKEKS